METRPGSSGIEDPTDLTEQGMSLRVLVTGHDGYIGRVLMPMLAHHGHKAVGLDMGLFEGCEFGEPPPAREAIRIDVREVEPAALEGFDAIIHLAGFSNDPLGDLNPSCTYEVNHGAAVALGESARRAGVPLFIQSSSCSQYGASGHDLVDETADFRPVTHYAESKVLAERDLSRMASDTFSPVFLRSATAYGVSQRLRADLVVNNLVGYAYTTGRVLIKSDGLSWRPLVHVEDISRAFLAVLHAPRELVHNRAFNVGRSGESYRIREVAEIVADVVSGSRIELEEGAGPDVRCYRVDCRRIERTLPGYQPRWTVRDGVRELYAAYSRHGLTLDELESSRYLRIRHVRELQASGRLDADLRWVRS